MPLRAQGGEGVVGKRRLPAREDGWLDPDEVTDARYGVRAFGFLHRGWCRG